MADVEPTEVDRETVRSMAHAGAQVVEVLGRKEFERAHIEGALHIPLHTIDRQTVEVLQREGPVIVYCYDFQ